MLTREKSPEFIELSIIYTHKYVRTYHCSMAPAAAAGALFQRDAAHKYTGHTDTHTHMYAVTRECIQNAGSLTVHVEECMVGLGRTA